MITIHDAALHMGIDYQDNMVTANLQKAVNSATYRLQGSVGKDVEEYLPGDARIESLLLIYAEEAYDNHVGSAKQDAVKNHLRDLYELQLRLELKQAKEAAGGGGA